MSIKTGINRRPCADIDSDRLGKAKLMISRFNVFQNEKRLFILSSAFILGCYSYSS